MQEYKDQFVTAVQNGMVSSRYAIGARLGASIKHAYTDTAIDFKKEGGLKVFCEKYLSENVLYLGRTGSLTGDNIFYVFDQSMLDLKSKWVLLKHDDLQDSQRCWDLFSNPILKGRLAVSRAGESFWATLSMLDVPANAEEICHIRQGDLADLLQEYRRDVGSDLVGAMEKASQEASRLDTDIGLGWLTVLRSNANSNLLVDWEQWLHKRFSTLLQGKFTYPSIPLFLACLSKGRTAGDRKNNTEDTSGSSYSGVRKGAIQSQPLGVTLQQNSDSNELKKMRDIVTTVVAKLSYDELRQLKLPLGLVMDALLDR